MAQEGDHQKLEHRVSNKSSSCEIEEMSFNISNLGIFRPSTN